MTWGDRGGRARGFFCGLGARHVQSVCTRVVECARPHPYALPLYPCAARADACVQLLAVMSRASRRPGFWTEGSRAAVLYQGLRLAKVSALNLANSMVVAKAYRHGGERGERGGPHAHGFFCGSGARIVRSVWCTRGAECGRHHPYTRPPHPCAVKAGACAQLLLAVMRRVSRRPMFCTEGPRAIELYQGLRLARVTAPNLANSMVAVKADGHGGEMLG